jgi:thiamine transport system permease protein
MRRSRSEALLYGLLPTLFLLLFFALPVLNVLLHALGLAAQGWAALGELLTHPQRLAHHLGEALRNIFASPYHRGRILFTFHQATLSTLVTLLIGLPLAYIFSHYRFPLRRTLRAAFTAPFVLPAIVVALALHAYVGPRGVLGWDLLGTLGPLGAIVLAHTFYNTSLILRVVGNHWERLPTAYAEAGRTLGLGPWRTLWRVELPLVRAPILAAALLVFVFNLTSFGVILLLAGDRAGTIETLIFEELRGAFARPAVAAALAVLQLVVTYLALTAFALLQRRHRAPLVPRTHTVRARLPSWAAPILTLATLLLVGPPIALVAASFRYGGQWSPRAYELLAGDGHELGAYTVGEAIRNSLAFATAALILALTLAFLAALAAQRRRRTSWAEGLLLLPLGVSSIVVGLGLLLTWDGHPLPDLRTSSLRIIAAHTLIAFPFAARILSPALDAVEPGLREAARSLGAGPAAVARLVDFPLAYPALGVAAIYSFGASLGEFGAVLMLRRPETTTIPLAIYDGFSRVGAPFHAQATALAALLLIVALLAFLLLERLRVRPWGEFG